MTWVRIVSQSQSYVELIRKAKGKGYDTTLLFLSLSSQELAIRRVKTRVNEGGHYISEDIIKRRFKNGLINLFQLYIPIVNRWILIDNSGENFQIIAEGAEKDIIIKNNEIWTNLNDKYHET